MINSYLVDDLWVVKAPDPPFNKYNEPNTPVVTAVKGLINWETRLVRDMSGNEVTTNTRVLMKTDTDLGHEDMLRIYDPVSDANIDYPIIVILPAKGYTTVGIYVFLGGRQMMVD